MATFRVLFVIDATIAVVLVYFFFAGVADGSVSSFNIALWMAVLGGIGAILGGGALLRSSRMPRLANGLLLVLAIPGVGCGLRRASALHVPAAIAMMRVVLRFNQRRLAMSRAA